MMSNEELRSHFIEKLPRTEDTGLLSSLFPTLLKEEDRSYIAVRAAWQRHYFKQLLSFSCNAYAVILEELEKVDSGLK